MERRFLISGEKWREIGFDITNSHRERDFRSHFGGSSDAIAWLWYLIRSYVPKLPNPWGAIELLQSLYFLKSPGFSWSTSSSRFKICEKTFKKHLEITLYLLDYVLPEVCLNIF
jgi:hypothetical protein